MSKTCPKCKTGTIKYFDGSYNFEPRYYCDKCNYETNKVKKMKEETLNNILNSKVLDKDFKFWCILDFYNIDNLGDFDDN
jgi:ribosomal protein S27AE